MKNAKGYSYTIAYRLDDIEDYDNTEYIDYILTKKEAMKRIQDIKNEYGSQIVLLDLMKYNEDDELVDAETII